MGPPKRQRFTSREHAEPGRRTRTKFIVVAVIAMIATQVFALAASGISARNEAIVTAERSIVNEGRTATRGIQRFLQPPQRLIDDTVGLLDRGVLTPTGDDIEQYLLTRLASLDLVASAFIGRPDGSFVNVSTDVSGPPSFLSTRLDPLSNVETSTTYDEVFTPIQNQQIETNFDPRNRIWYTGAAASDAIAWSEPTILFEASTAGVYASKALRDDTGQVIAVVGVAVRLTGLSAFLDDLDLGNGAEAFVASGDDVIGFPDRSQVDYRTGPTGDVLLPSLAELDMSAAMATVQDNDVAQVDDDLVYRADIAVGRNVNWTLVLRSPIENFTGSADAQQNNVLRITLASSVVFLLALVLLIRITKPIASLAEQATTDPLTGLSNRRHISSIGQTMLRQLRRDEHLFVLVIDLDNFKQLNDSHGHHMGDHALVLVAEQLAALTRRGDLLGRLGGDEFVVALPTTELSTGIDTGRRIIARLSDALTMALPDSGLGVTGGLTANSADTVDFEELLVEADQALITAKAEAKGMLLVSNRLVDSSI